MNKVIRYLILSLLLVLPCSFTAAAETPQQDNQESVHLIILHTNDMHGRILPEDDRGNAIGLPEIAAGVNVIRQHNAPVLLLDAGDTFHGMPAINISKGMNMVKLLNAMGYDAMVPGNHDYNYGSPRLLELTKALNFPVLSANTADKATGKLLFPDYTIIEKDGVKIGLFGITTPDTSRKTAPENVRSVKFTDAVTASKAMVKKLQGKADVIVAIMHVGVEPASSIISTDIAKAVPGIDVIIDGHSHTELPEGITVGTTLIAQTGYYDHRLGRVDIWLENGKITAKQAQLYTAANLQAIAPQSDAEIANMITAMDEENAPLFAQVIARSNQSLPNEYEIVRSQETALGDLAADALRSTANSDIALVNGGSIRAALPEGDITMGDMMTIFPFGNTIKKVAMTGGDITAALEHSISGYPDISGGFLQVSGIEFTFDPALPAGQRITSIKVNGRPLQADTVYTVAMNDFMAAGGDGNTAFTKGKIAGEYGTCEEAMAAYLNTHGVTALAPAGRIVIAPSAAVKTDTANEAELRDAA